MIFEFFSILKKCVDSKCLNCLLCHETFSFSRIYLTVVELFITKVLFEIKTICTKGNWLDLGFIGWNLFEAWNHLKSHKIFFSFTVEKKRFMKRVWYVAILILYLKKKYSPTIKAIRIIKATPDFLFEVYSWFKISFIELM